MITLGIETSCDETALAIIETRTAGVDFEYRVLGSLIHSQAELHSAYGGVYPALAKREHGKNLVPLLHKLLSTDAVKSHIKIKSEITTAEFAAILDSFQAEIAPQNVELFQSFRSADFLRQIPSIDKIAVTEGPGLEPALWTGINMARMLGAAWKIPVIAANHMEGHVVGSLLEVAPEASGSYDESWHTLKKLPEPAVALLISGGHTELIEVRSSEGHNHQGAFKYQILGQTKDDAVGEAFDKSARLLGLPYPGGPELSKLANEARTLKINAPVSLPRPMMHSGDLDFSFSGLKTAVLYAVRDAAKVSINKVAENSSQNTGNQAAALSDDFRRGLAREFEDAVKETLDAKLRLAIEKIGAKSVIIGGGVSANKLLRETFATTASEYDIPLFLPDRHVSGDNALMIALAGALDTSPHNKSLKAHGTKKLGA